MNSPNPNFQSKGGTPEKIDVPNQITVVCCYCQQTMEVKEGNGVSGISHGICYSCFTETREKWKQQIDAFRKTIVHKVAG